MSLRERALLWLCPDLRLQSRSVIAKMLQTRRIFCSSLIIFSDSLRRDRRCRRFLAVCLLLWDISLHSLLKWARCRSASPRQRTARLHLYRPYMCLRMTLRIPLRQLLSVILTQRLCSAERLLNLVFIRRWTRWSHHPASWIRTL